ncbi:MAG: hypothetical protein HYZ38_19290 [Mycobacterium sp.]|nr:hypothetical protein [Mycobacterium sp.]
MTASPNHAQPTPRSRWRRIVAGGVVGAGVAVSLSLGFGTATASADVLDQLASEYSIGAGAGQIANLLNDSLVLRAQGFRPKPGDLAAIQDAMDKRPNQMPLINALTQTVAHQRKVQQQMGGQGGSPPVVLGINSIPWNPGNPMIQETPIFPIPGRS